MDSISQESLVSFDAQHLWHPYTSIEKPLPTYLVRSANGVRIQLADGRELIDGMASWWSVIHGYNHPELTKILQEQAAELSHVMFGGLTHKPAIDLGQKLVGITPEKLCRVFLADSGSVSVEVAMKMAMQYFFAQGISGKNRFLTVRSGYHGDTFHAMSVCDPDTGMHSIYKGVLPEYYFAEAPQVRFREQWEATDVEPLRTLLVEHQQTICAIILEPIVQGAGGMRFYHPAYLQEVRKLCDQYGVLLICDEIATGFGRSGELFACNHAGVCPDIMCVGKALTGGYMTLAAVLATDRVGKTISSGEPGVFMHGPTFMGNPLACAVAAKSIDLLIQSDWKNNLARIEKLLTDGFAPCQEFAGVKEVRVLGAIGVIELQKPVNMATIQAKFVDKGVWVRPFGKLVYVMPPYVMTDVDLKTLTKAICEVVAEEVSA